MLDEDILLVRSNTELRGHVTVPASITSIGRFSSYGPSVFHAGAAFSNAPTTFGANIACSSIIDARGGIAVSGFLSNAALTLTDSGGGLALLSAPLHSTQDVHLQKELKVHGNATFDTHVSVNGTLYAKNLHPSFNTFQASNILISQGGIIQFGEGVSSTISFSNAPDTGLFNPVARTLGVVAGGTEMVRVSDTTVSLLGDLVVSSNIVPMTNATQYIGTSTMHFKEAWIDELHISSNTLYIGDTPVLCADNDAVSIRADPGQGITITTTGDGETSLVSAKGVNVVSEGGVTMRVSGPLGRVNIQSSGAGGTVNLGAENEIVMTAPLTTISSNMIVKGDLIVEGTQLTVNTQTVTIEDNIIVLNSGEIGSGVSKGEAGFSIDRGDAPEYQLLFRESDNAFVIGPLDSLTPIATETFAGNANNISSGTLAVDRGGTGVSVSTGTGSVVLSVSPTFTGTTNFASLTTSNLDVGGLTTLNGKCMCLDTLTVGVGVGDDTVYPLHIKTSVDNVSLFSVGDMVMYSDIRTKSDVLPIPDALERVGRLRGYTFIKNGGDETRRSCGLIAQELLDVLPEAVHAHPESGMLTVAYGNVVSLLVNAINELKAQVDTLSGT
jgi:hypothetical protein